NVLCITVNSPDDKPVEQLIDRWAVAQIFQSAVSPNCIRQGAARLSGVGAWQRLAECNSAIQQSITLRYEVAPNTCPAFWRPADPSASSLRRGAANRDQQRVGLLCCCEALPPTAPAFGQL